MLAQHSGGKLAHILECEPTLAACVAVEKDKARLPVIQDNLTRLSLAAQCINADANDVKEWWDGQLFDRILLDAPCSASGVIRRHPDIKLLRQPADIQAFAREQLRLLTSLLAFIKTRWAFGVCNLFDFSTRKCTCHATISCHAS